MRWRRSSRAALVLLVVAACAGCTRDEADEYAAGDCQPGPASDPIALGQRVKITVWVAAQRVSDLDFDGHLWVSGDTVDVPDGQYEVTAVLAENSTPGTDGTVLVDFGAAGGQVTFTGPIACA